MPLAAKIESSNYNKGLFIFIPFTRRVLRKHINGFFKSMTDFEVKWGNLKKQEARTR